MEILTSEIDSIINLIQYIRLSFNSWRNFVTIYSEFVNEASNTHFHNSWG